MRCSSGTAYIYVIRITLTDCLALYTTYMNWTIITYEPSGEIMQWINTTVKQILIAHTGRGSAFRMRERES